MLDRRQKVVLQKLFCQIARDSRYEMDQVKIAQLVASILDIHPFMVMDAMGGYSKMREVALGHLKPIFPEEEK